MAVKVVMPALEMAQETGKVISWKKNEGEPVAKGEALLEIETDKAAVEIEAPADGILVGIRAVEGDVIPVGQIIAWVVQPGEKILEEGSSGEPTSRRKSRVANAGSLPSSSTKETAGRGLKITPKARRLALELGVDTNLLKGSGPCGELLASDIVAAAQSGGASPTASGSDQIAGATENLEALNAVGRLMAERTAQSWTAIPHFFVAREADASGLIAAHEKLAPESQDRPSHTDILVALVARLLPKHPRLNASWTRDGIRHHAEVNIGIAVAVEGGVVAPVISGAGRFPLLEIAVRRRDLAVRARAHRLRPEDIRGATFTISNLGMYHVDAFTAIITTPQAAILAVGAIADRVVARNGRPAIRPMMSMTLSCDHRVVDGARAALFLNDLVEACADPEAFLR